MAKQRWKGNTIYISQRLREELRPIEHCALTTVVAPMGYGKTTAVSWYLAERIRQQQAAVLRVSVYSDSLPIFWQSVQAAFTHAGIDLLRDYECPQDEASASLLIDDLCRTLALLGPCYLFIDDFHLLADPRASAFLCVLARRLPENAHLIVAGRDEFLPPQEVLRLGRHVWRIGAAQLRLEREELDAYARRCGAELSDHQVEQLLHTTEGWFSAAYLSLQTLAERGTLPDGGSDIYTMFSAAMIQPLSLRRQAFLAMLGLADEFTAEMAQAVTEYADAASQIADLTARNAFVTRLPDGVTYRFHHMMKECAQRTFRTLPPESQQSCRRRYGQWYEERGQYLQALRAYGGAEDFDGVLRVVEKDAGILLALLPPEQVLSWLDRCLPEVLERHPLAMLVLMRSMFNWRNIPRMLELRQLLLTAIDEDTQRSAEERGNLLGECDLIMSFLCYNDISAMSRLHRSASAQMSRPAVSIQSSGGWTFGSPSVLMMFYRAPGELESELAEMDECMPHYYKITGSHGQGAETIMHAEAAFMQGRFTDAHIALERAYAQIEGNGQENMALCCDFLARRLSLFTDIGQRAKLEKRRERLLAHHDVSWLNLWNAAAAYHHALLGSTDSIPEAYRRHRLFTVRTLAPGKPMIEMIENQVYLAQGEYAHVIGRSEGLLTQCEAMHYALVALHIRIKTAAAYEMLGKHGEARALLERALADAEPDGFALPFAENFRYLEPLLTERLQDGLTGRIVRLGGLAGQRRAAAERPAVLAALTERECAIVGLMTQRLSNREIAEKLYLSEGSVRQYVN